MEVKTRYERVAEGNRLFSLNNYEVKYNGGVGSGIKGHTTPKKKSIKEVFGKQFKGYKGEEAIKKLLKERRGYVPNAFYRDEIGGIHLAWGENNEEGRGYGLKHIKEQREKQNINIDDFLDNIPEVVETGNLKQEKDGTFRSFKNKKMTIIGERKDLKKRVKHLITAYIREKDKK